MDSSGNLIWKFDSGGSIYNTSIICSNEKVLFGNDNGLFFAIGLDGKLLWKFKAGDAIRTTPALINNKIIFGSHDHNMYCLDYEGRLQWKFITGGIMWTCPCIISSDGELLWSIGYQDVKSSDKFVIYFGCFDGGLYCLDENGKFVWKYHTNGITSSGPEFSDGVIYFGSSDGYLYAVNHSARNLRWKCKTTSRIGHSSPLIAGDSIFVGDFNVDETSTSGSLYCINRNGSLKWKFSTGNAIVSTPLIHKGILFFGSCDGFLYAISLKKEELLWKFRTLYEKVNFDQLKSIKHTEIGEERLRNILSTWAPETSLETAKNRDYESQKTDYNKNVTLYGSSKDAEKFSYGQDYRNKRKPYN